MCIRDRDETAKVLVERADADWEGIWTLTYAAGRATADLCVVASMADAVELTYAAMDLGGQMACVSGPS